LYATTAGIGPAIEGETSTGAAGVQGSDQTGSQLGIGVDGGSVAGRGVEGYLESGDDAAAQGEDGVAAVAAIDNSPGGAFTYGLYGTSQNIAVYGTSSNNISARFSGGHEGFGMCTFYGGTGWECSSDRNLKKNLTAVDLPRLLDRLAAMPVFEFSMKGAKQQARFLGPMAQDFAAAFHLGTGDTTINTGDAQGVALAAAKGLYEKLQADEATIAALRAQLAQLRQEENGKLAALRTAVERLTRAVPIRAAAQ